MGPALLRWIVATLASLASGCLIIPYAPPARVSTTTPTRIESASASVTLGSRRQLEALQSALTERDARITCVDALAFRDTAFPRGDWTLERLLAADTRELVRPLGVDYAVLVGPLGFEEDTLVDAFTWYLGFFGLGLLDERVDVAALVVDLASAEAVAAITSESTGRRTAVGLFYGLILWPWTESSASSGLARGLIAALAKLQPQGPLHLVLLSLESPSLSRDLRCRQAP